MKLLTRIGISLLLAPLACFYTQLAAAQVKIQSSNFSGSVIVQPTGELRLKLDRLPSAEEGKLAFFVGKIDLTSQFKQVGTEFVYQPAIVSLPLGKTTVTVYLVNGNQWQEVAQLPLNVGPSVPEQSIKPGVEPEKQPSGESSTPETSSEQTPTQAPEASPIQPDKVRLSTSAADLNNSFQPQLSPLSQRQQVPKLEPIQAKPDAAPTDFTTSFKPRMNIAIKSQFMEQRTGDTEPSERPTFIDSTIETGFEAEVTSGTFGLRSKFSMLGVTFQPEALRFKELGEEAPEFDLSEYLIDAKWGPAQFTLGHLCYGSHPFLLNSVCSRGMTFKVNVSDRVDFSINSMSATSIIGFDNMTGLDNFNNNNITAATLGFQLVKNNFGGIRLEASIMDGKRQAVSDFNAGEVVDAEKSRGFGFRLFGADNSGRLRIDVGYARSTFTNPPERQLVDASAEADARLAEEFTAEAPTEETPTAEAPTEEVPTAEAPTEPSISDPLPEPSLTEAPADEASVEAPANETAIANELVGVVNGRQELVVVPVKPVTKTAFYADVSYDLLKDVKLIGDRTVSLTLNAHHERIDPQFQTVGATVTADQLRTVIGMNASIAGATVQFQQEWSEDNLANVPTILKTKTRNTSLNVNIPLQTVLGSSSRFLPTLSYSYQRVQQVGANTPIPELSSFDPTEIPNQINQQHQASIQWTFDELSLGYTFASSFQDNRQLSRENADFFNLSHQVSLNWQPSSRFQLTVGYSVASAESKEEGITRFNSSPTIGINWEFIKNLTLTLNYNTTSDRDSLNQKFTQATGLEAILTWRFRINAGNGSQLPGSAFIRYSQQSSLNRDNVFGSSTDFTIQVINAGLSISF